MALDKVKAGLEVTQQGPVGDVLRFIEARPLLKAWVHTLTNPKHIKRWAWIIFRFILIAGLSYIILTPVIFMLSMSFRLPWDNMDPSIVWVPKNFSLIPFSEALKTLNVFKEGGDFFKDGFNSSLLETLRINVLTGLFQVASTCVVGYGLARFKFPFRGLVFGLVLFTVVVPSQTIMTGLAILMNKLHLTGPEKIVSGGAFWFPAILGGGLRSGIFIYVYRQFFRGQPKELEEAAVVDGCGYVGTFLRILLPGATSIIITVFLFALVWQWNEYYSVGIFMTDNKTLAVALSGLTSNTNVAGLQSAGLAVSNQYTMASMIQAGCLVVSAPILIIYVILQRYFTESIARSGIVG